MIGVGGIGRPDMILASAGDGQGSSLRQPRPAQPVEEGPIAIAAPARAVARVERQRNPGPVSPHAKAIPDFASLNPGYSCSARPAVSQLLVSVSE